MGCPLWVVWVGLVLMVGSGFSGLVAVARGVVVVVVVGTR